MNLEQRAEFERRLEAYAHMRIEAAAFMNARDTCPGSLVHLARCDLITWVEQNVERPAQPIDDTSGGN